MTCISSLLRVISMSTFARRHLQIPLVSECLRTRKSARLKDL